MTPISLALLRLRLKIDDGKYLKYSYRSSVHQFIDNKLHIEFLQMLFYDVVAEYLNKISIQFSFL
jgi:hypothetical protein